MPTFDGTNQLIILDAGVTTVDVEKDLYSAWKTFFKTGTNSRFPLAFRGSVGGDNLPGVTDAGAYFFLQNQNGWRIRPAEENATISLFGNLVPEDDTLPILIPTIGAFTVLVNGIQPITQNVDRIPPKVWDASRASHVIAGSFGEGVASVQGNVTGTVKGHALKTGTVLANGSNTASTFQTDLTETVDNHWKDVLIKFTSGPLMDQVKKISLYNGTTKFITVSEPFTSAPLSTNAFMLVNE